jgi:hypothetical protein
MLHRKVVRNRDVRLDMISSDTSNALWQLRRFREPPKTTVAGGKTVTEPRSEFPLSAMRSRTVDALALSIVVALAACARVSIAPQPKSFSSSDRLVGTYYFYWYKYPTSHFFDDAKRQDDALTDHFPKAKEVDYESVEWHCRQLSDMAWCGIDFVLPVYWGAPGNYDKPVGMFSTRGLDAMQKARDRLLARGKPCPRIGMFYDTTTLLNGLRGDRPPNGKADLTTQHGKDVFYGTIRDYWKRLERKHWAMLDGRPITVLYSASFAAKHDQSAFDYVYQSFERDFGARPYIIAETSWRLAKADASYRWGAALSGPILSDVAAIGPGYDDRAVPGRSTPVRDRENGRFYEYGWLEAIRSGRRIVLLETWNEMHEGTDICRSREYGRKYMDLTRRYGQLFKKQIVLEHRKPLPFGPLDKGREFANERELFINFAESKEKGLQLIRQSDGAFEITQAGGRRCVRSAKSDHSYLYFAVPDPFLFNAKTSVTVEIEYLDSGSGGLGLEYDSRDETVALDGAYKNAGSIAREGTNQWKTRRFQLGDALFCNRENGGSDFRIAVRGDPVGVSRISVAKLGKKE